MYIMYIMYVNILLYIKKKDLLALIYVLLYCVESTTHCISHNLTSTQRSESASGIVHLYHSKLGPDVFIFVCI